MTALIIIGAILLLIFLVLFLPVNVFLKFQNDFFIKIKFAGIKLFEISEKEKKSDSDKKTDKDGKKNEDSENPALKQGKELFSFLKEKYGFSGAVKKVFSLLKDMLTHIKNLLRHIKIKKIKLDLTVSGADAADTAIEYGRICTAAYPVLAFFDSFSGIDFKQININSDFNGNKKEFEFSLVVKLQIIYLLIAAFKIYSEYKNFTIKENYNERKQH